MNRGLPHIILSSVTLACAVTLAGGCGRLPLINWIIDNDTLPERVSDADIVIIGRLVSVNERGLTEEEMTFDSGQYYRRYVFYDLGKIEVQEVLEGNFSRDYIYVKFLSFDQTQPPPNDKADCAAFSFHNIWNAGIWLIERDTDREPRFKVRRGNFVPLNRLGDVKGILGKY